jgi:hypothetical protein
MVPGRAAGPPVLHVGSVMEEDREERRGFRVTDRRRFSDTGEARQEAPADAPPESQTAAKPPGPEPRRPARGSAAEPVSFSTFVLGLSTQVLLHLGEIPSPVTNAVERDLDAAKQVIDILGILREKTRNNLDQTEENLLDSVLYDLRLRYVELVRGGTKERP